EMEWLQTLDHNLVRWFPTHRTPPLDAGMAALTFLGELVVLFVVLAVGVAWLAVCHHGRRALLAAMTGLLCWGLAEGVKEGVKRPRPDFAGHPMAPVRLFNPEQPTYSFPSVHSSGSSSVYVTLALLIGKGWPRRRRVLSVGGSLLLTGLIGVSRVYLGYHYPTDVVAGWALGLGFAFSCAALDEGKGFSL